MELTQNVNREVQRSLEIFKSTKSAEIMQSVMGKTLSRPTETRWNSLYDSLKQVVDARPFMEELKVRLNISQVGTCTFIFSNK